KNAPSAGQLADGHGGIRFVFASAYGHVDTRVDNVQIPVGGDDLDVDVRIALVERVQQRYQLGDAKRQRTDDMQGAGRLAGNGLDFFFRFRHVRQHGFAALIEALSDVGQDEA